MAEPTAPAPTRTARPIPSPPPAQPLAAQAAAPAKPVQKLREVQVRKLLGGSLKASGQFTYPHTALLPGEWDFEDVLNPDFWVHHAKTLQNIGAPTDGLPQGIGCTFEILPKDLAFYGQVMVKGLRKNVHGEADGVYVICIGPLQDENGKACPIDLKTGLPWKGRKKPDADAKAA